MKNQRGFRVGFWLGDASLEYGGIGPYAFRVLTALVEDHEPGWRIVLLCGSEPGEKLKRTVARFPCAVEVSLIPSAPANSNYFKAWLEGLRLDLLHFPTQTILHRDLQVPYSLTMYGVEELPHLDPGVPCIVTMHDVQELHYPENFTPAQRAIRAVQYWKAMEKARKVIVSFDHVKKDLVRFFQLPEDKVHVCPIPFRWISLSEPTPEAAESYGAKYEAWSRFLLYPSHTWRHKNHILLLKALKDAQRRHHLDLRLICTGGINHHYHAEVLAQVEALGLTDSVLFAGIVPEDELRWLYQHTALVTIPTKYEAGSFPLYEAMIEGVPVVCSDVTSLPETINDRRFVFDTENVEGLSDLIFRMLSDAQFRRENLANSKEQAQRLRQVNAASYFYRTYSSLLGDDAPHASER